MAVTTVVVQLGSESHSPQTTELVVVEAVVVEEVVVTALFFGSLVVVDQTPQSSVVEVEVVVVDLVVVEDVVFETLAGSSEVDDHASHPERAGVAATTATKPAKAAAVNFILMIWWLLIS